MINLLDKVVQLEKSADEFGFRWENSAQIMAQIESECIEIKEHLPVDANNQPALQEEIGDLLHAVFSLCVYCQFDPTDTLQKTLNKFERRLTAVKDIASTQGLSHLNGYAFDELMRFWNEAKKQVG